MEEVYELGDRIAVLRDGRLVGTGTRDDIPQERLTQLMVGRDLAAMVAPPNTLDDNASIVLKATHLSDGATVHDVSFNLRAGEILGIAGLMGAGRSEIAEILIGLRYGQGSVTLRGQPFVERSPRSAMERGLVLVSEDRRRDQAFLNRAVRENLTATILQRMARGVFGRLALDQERNDAAGAAATFGIQHPGLEAFMLALSGGNQQKTIIARWLQTNPHVCILDEPTKGVDIGARAEMYRLIRERAAGGVAFLLISSDLPELLGLAHRLLVVYKGRIAGELPRAQAEPHRILAMASTGRAA